MAAKRSTQEILNSENETGSILFVLFIPSVDGMGKALPSGQDQQMWASAAGDVLSRLFGGSTQMPPAKGKWLNDKTNKIITEEIVLVHSYASETDAENPAKLTELAKFLHRMGKQTNQGEIGVVIGDVFHRIRKFPLAGVKS